VKRINVDNVGPAVKSFLRSLPIARDDIEVELDGKVVCKIVAPNKLSESEKSALRKKGRELLRRTHQRIQDVPSRVIAQEVEAAIRAVRGRG
jgi:hypothetical protein